VQLIFKQRKNALFRRAAELSAMCDCEVAVVVFGPAGELSQFSSSEMEMVLRRYSQACTDVHESHSAAAMQKRRLERSGSKSLPAKKRGPGTGLHRAGSGVSGRGAATTPRAAAGEDARQDLPALSPRSADAYEHIDREFDKLIEGRAKRAQQAARAPSPAGDATTSEPSPPAGGVKEGEDGVSKAVSGGSSQGEDAPRAAAAAAVSSGAAGGAAAAPRPACAFEFLAAALAGDIEPPPPAAATEASPAAAACDSPADPPLAEAGVVSVGVSGGPEVVATPAVVITPLGAGAAEGDALDAAAAPSSVSAGDVGDAGVPPPDADMLDLF
jgi:hypothetical protein